MEKGGGGGGGSLEYTKKISTSNTTSSSGQDSIKEDCSDINISTTITKPIVEMLKEIEEGSVLQLNFPERVSRIEILNYEQRICGYVTSSVDRLINCYDKGHRFEVILMKRNSETSYEILVHNKR